MLELIIGYYRDIKNWFRYSKIIRGAFQRDRETIWPKFNIRLDWVNRVYTVVNLRKEDIGEIETIRMHRVLEYLFPINEYLEGLGLVEVIRPNLNPIPPVVGQPVSSWLVVYHYHPHTASWRNTFLLGLYLLITFVALFGSFVLYKWLSKSGVIKDVMDWISYVLS